MISGRHKTWFNLAKRISFKSPSRFKIGSVIVKNSKVLNIGWNDMQKSHTKCKNTYGNFIHSELRALIGLSYEETRSSDIYVYRETLKGDLAKSKPCPICHEELTKAGIKNVYYTSELGYHRERLF